MGSSDAYNAFFVTDKKLAEFTGMSQSSITKAKRELRENGLLTIFKSHLKNKKTGAVSWNTVSCYKIKIQTKRTANDPKKEENFTVFLDKELDNLELDF